MKYETEKYVIFGVFSNSLKSPAICKVFIENTKNLIKTEKERPIGRIWCLEVNGTGRGCGVVAADDKIKIWKDKLAKKKAVEVGDTGKILPKTPV